MKFRKHFSHLPNVRVLGQILKIEAKRKTATNKHYPKFNLLISWLGAIGIDTNFIENDSSWEKLIVKGNHLRKIVAQKTISGVKNKDENLISILEKVEDYLGEENFLIPENIDILFVFGSRDLGRIQKAAEIYNRHRVEKILIAGGARYDTKEKGRPEAEVFKDKAVELGIPENKIIVELNSITIADNVRSGLNLLDKLDVKYSNIVTMVSWFAQRRTWSHLMKYTDGVHIIRVNSEPKSKELTQGSWYKYETGVNVIFSEFLKMKIAVLIDTA